MNKQQIFQHLLDTFVFVAKLGGFKHIHGVNDYVLTSFLSPAFNIFYLGDCYEPLIEELIYKKIPFELTCKESFENDFPIYCESKNLIKTDDIIANIFSDLQNWKYEKKTNLDVRRVQNIKEFQDFDFISSICFKHPRGMAFEYLKSIIDIDLFALFVGYVNNKPVTCGMISFVNEIPGLYWGGVLPENRKVGFGTDITEYRMDFIKKKNYDLVIAQNMSTSAKYYQKIGFKSKGTLPFYLFGG